MHPAPSVILFTTLSGLGFGLLAVLGAGIMPVAGGLAFLWWGLGYGLAVTGLVASTFHLGRPERAWRAFTQWRSSWLSREAWASVGTLLLLAPQALSDWLGLGWGRIFGMAGALGCLATVLCTAMIYAQLKTVPRWHHWTVPVTFLAFSITGGFLMAGTGLLPAALAVLLGFLLVAGWKTGDTAFARSGVSLGDATGLSGIGTPSVFEQPHTGGNYLLREMIHVVGRRHAARLRIIALVLASVVPALCALLLSGWWGVVPAVLSHLLGAMAARWLFFAEAEHVVGLYYGKR
jgi:DMSO reductase anchor subunit